MDLQKDHLARLVHAHIAQGEAWEHCEAYRRAFGRPLPSQAKALRLADAILALAKKVSA